MTKFALAAALLAAPLAARADIGVRVGANAALAYNNNDGQGTHIITDNWPVGLDAMISYWIPTSLLSIDAELGEQWIFKNPNQRIGTVFRPGIRLSPPILPIYVRGAIPINIETANCPSGITCREKVDLRLGAGITIPLILFKVYIEADVDTPISSGGYASAFQSWNFLLNGGLDFRF